MSLNNFADVGHFHHRFGLHSVNHDGWGQTPFDSELMEFRIKFMLEELQEFCQGAGYKLWVTPEGVVLERQPDWNPDHAQMFDALIDLVYVALGTAHLNGYPWLHGWALVQNANMQKVRAAKDGSDSKRGSSFDVVKPEGWTPPDIEGLLKSYGWNTF